MARKDQYKSDLIHTLETRLDFVRGLLNDLERKVQGFDFSGVEESDEGFSKVWMRADDYFRAFPHYARGSIKPHLPIMQELVDLARRLEKVTDGEIDIEDDALSLTAYFGGIQRRAEAAQEELEELDVDDYADNITEEAISDIEYDIASARQVVTALLGY